MFYSTGCTECYTYDNGSKYWYITIQYSCFIVLAVQNAIPMIMGANIGTSLTNTLVSFSQVSDRGTHIFNK